MTTTASVAAWLGSNDEPDSTFHPLREIEPDGPDAVPALRRLLADLDALGAPSMLTDAKLALEKSSEINQQAASRQNAAIQRITEARQRAALADDTIAALEAMAAEQRDAEPWLPVQPGQDSPLMSEARRLSRASVQRAVMLAGGKGDLIYRKLQEFAADAVDQVGAAPLPEKVWVTPEPAALVMRSEHAESWTTLLMQGDRFMRLHEAADLTRRLGGLLSELPGAAPRLAFQYRAWLTAQQQFEELRTVARPLRLRWAIDHGWQPGLWRPDQINGNGDPTPTPLTIGARLKHAVGGA
ncbi:hypothetical protein AB0L70_10070 [Kribbella sp. NPDC051952]|uniref:hypothetical protein n=1 Tax=Kribbella sp. NPDC051952 TaxID=3154851 RepID=UPI0034429348